MQKQMRTVTLSSNFSCKKGPGPGEERQRGASMNAMESVPSPDEEGQIGRDHRSGGRLVPS